MAFPWVFESNFEAGTNAEWDSETDTDTVLDIVHYSTLAKMRHLGSAAPYRGAYCMRIVLNGGTNPANLVEGDIDITATATAYVRFMLYLGNDFTATADDVINIFKVIDTATTEGVLSLKITAATGLVELGVGETNGTVFGGSLTRGKWHAIEGKFVNDPGANDGTVTAYLDGAQVATVGSLNQGAITTGSFGSMDHLATTTGTLLFDQFVFDDARIYPISQRYPQTMLLTKSSHVFTGTGTITNAQMLSGAGTDNVLAIFDTDVAKVTDASNISAEIKNTANGEVVDVAGVPVSVNNGCFVQLAGTNPRALITVGDAQGYYSAGRVRQHGVARNVSGGF